MFFINEGPINKENSIWVLLPNFWPIFLIKFQKNQKIAKNNENPKKYIFDIFASFLAFSTSSQKNLNFQRYLKRVQLLTRKFYDHWFFLLSWR